MTSNLSSSSVDNDLSELKNSNRSSFVILKLLNNQQTTSPYQVNESPSPPSATKWYTPYAVGQNNFSTTKGSLEDDGGLEGLRSLLSYSEEIQFVFLKFRSNILLVQYLPERTHAVWKARAMVTGRLLGSKIPCGSSSSIEGYEELETGSRTPPSRLTAITISHPRQLTDPFLRSQTATGSSNGSPTRFFPRSYTQTTFSSSNAGSEVDFAKIANQSQGPDVPQSVSSATLTCSPFPASTSMSTLDSTTSVKSPDEQISLSRFPAVGLGIGGFGQNVISPFRDTFEGENTTAAELEGQITTKSPSLQFSSKLENFGQFKLDNFVRSPDQEPTTSGSDSGIDEPIQSPEFPKPPQRASTMTTAESLKASHNAFKRRSSAVTTSTTGAFIDSYSQGNMSQYKEQEGFSENDSYSTIGNGSSSAAGQTSVQGLHVRSTIQTPTSPSIVQSISDNSSLSGHAGVIGSRNGGPNLTMKGGVGVKGAEYMHRLSKNKVSLNDIKDINLEGNKLNQQGRMNAAANRSTNELPLSLRKSVSMKALSFSASSAMTHESVFSSKWDANERAIVDSNEENKDLEQLEQERIDFLKWKRDQERMIVARERERECQRRILDEARREQVMRKLMAEQSLSTDELSKNEDGSQTSHQSNLQKATQLAKINAAATHSDSQSEEAKTSGGTALNSPYTKSFGRKSTESFKSRSKRSIHNLPSPPHPPPPIPLPRSPSMQDELGKADLPIASGKFAKESKMASDKSDSYTSEKQAKIEQSPPSRLDVSHKLEDLSYDLLSSPIHTNSRQVASAPLNDQVKAAIEREMRRPVITIEGHVRPRVRQTRIRSRTSSGTTRKEDLSLRLDTKSIGVDISEGMNKSPLISSMMEAQRAQARGSLNKSISDTSSLHMIGEDEQRGHHLLVSFPSSPFAVNNFVKTLDPDGKRVGSGWALSEVKGLQVGNKVDKDLPVLPFEEESSVEEALTTLTDDLYLKAWKKTENKTGTINPHETDPLQKMESLSDTNTADQTVAKDDEDSGNMTLIDQIFRSKMNSIQSKVDAVSDEIDDKVILRNGLSNDEFDAIRSRQDQLESLLTDLQRRRTIKIEEEGLARARWAREQARRRKLDAYERSLLESEEKLRRAKLQEEVQEEEHRQDLLEEEQAEIERRIEEENLRREIAERQRVIRAEKLRLAEALQTTLRKEIQEKHALRRKRRKDLFEMMKEKAESKESILKGTLTIQFGSGQRFKRRRFDLFSDRLCLYDLDQQSKLSQPSEIIQIKSNCLLSLSDAFEEVQVPHAFSMRLNPDSQSGIFQTLQEPIIAYTDTEQSKEGLVVALSMFSGFETNLQAF